MPREPCPGKRTARSRRSGTGRRVATGHGRGLTPVMSRGETYAGWPSTAASRARSAASSVRSGCSASCRCARGALRSSWDEEQRGSRFAVRRTAGDEHRHLQFLRRRSSALPAPAAAASRRSRAARSAHAPPTALRRAGRNVQRRAQVDARLGAPTRPTQAFPEAQLGSSLLEGGRQAVVNSSARANSASNSSSPETRPRQRAAVAAAHRLPLAAASCSNDATPSPRRRADQRGRTPRSDPGPTGSPSALPTRGRAPVARPDRDSPDRLLAAAEPQLDQTGGSAGIRRHRADAERREAHCTCHVRLAFFRAALGGLDPRRGRQARRKRCRLFRLVREPHRLGRIRVRLRPRAGAEVQGLRAP